VGTDYAVGGTGGAPRAPAHAGAGFRRRHVGRGLGDQQIGPEILRDVRRTYRLARCCCSANLLRNRVQCMKYMYRELARGGVVKRGVFLQSLLDEF
jgi:hypothetical protein